MTDKMLKSKVNVPSMKNKTQKVQIDYLKILQYIIQNYTMTI